MRKRNLFLMVLLFGVLGAMGISIVNVAMVVFESLFLIAAFVGVGFLLLVLAGHFVLFVLSMIEKLKSKHV